jgi:Phasin protein
MQNEFRQPSSAWNESNFSELGRQRVDELVTMQKDLLERFQKTNHHWLDRAQTEANLCSEFASKLTASRSIPEAVAAYQEWTGHHLDLMAEDGMHAFKNAQTLVDVYARFLSNGGLIQIGRG